MADPKKKRQNRKGVSTRRLPEFPHKAIFSTGRVRYYRTAEDALQGRQNFERARAAKKRRIAARRRSLKTQTELREHVAEPKFKVTASEKTFLGFMEKYRPELRLLRSGWPDFLVIDDENRLHAVEVKAYPDTLRKNQRECIEALELVGLETHVFRADQGDLVTWRRFLAEKKEAGDRYRRTKLRKVPRGTVERAKDPSGSEKRRNRSVAGE